MKTRLVWTMVAALAIVPPFACGGDDGANPGDGGDTGDGAGGCRMSDECRAGYLCNDTNDTCEREAPALPGTADMTCLHNNPGITPGTGVVTANFYVEDFQDDWRV